MFLSQRHSRFCRGARKTLNPYAFGLRLRLMSCVCIATFFFFSKACFCGFMSHQQVPCTVNGTHKSLFLATFSLKMGPTTLFKHLKIILQQCFLFSVLSGIQTNLRSIEMSDYFWTKPRYRDLKTHCDFNNVPRVCTNLPALVDFEERFVSSYLNLYLILSS